MKGPWSHKRIPSKCHRLQKASDLAVVQAALGHDREIRCCPPKASVTSPCVDKFAVRFFVVLGLDECREVADPRKSLQDESHGRLGYLGHLEMGSNPQCCCKKNDC